MLTGKTARVWRLQNIKEGKGRVLVTARRTNLQPESNWRASQSGLWHNIQTFRGLLSPQQALSALGGQTGEGLFLWAG